MKQFLDEYHLTFLDLFFGALLFLVLLFWFCGCHARKEIKWPAKKVTPIVKKTEIQ